MPLFRSIKSRKPGVALLLAVCMALGAGCAKIADPLPPRVRIPKPAVDLTARQSADAVELRVSRPEQNTDGSAAFALQSVVLYRLIEDAGESLQPLTEKQFIQQAERIQSIPSQSFSSYLRDKTFVLRDRPPQKPGLSPKAIRYAVGFANTKNQVAGLSNQAVITLLPIPPPPEGLSAEVTEAAIRLKWTAPAANMDGSVPARIAGYNIYRSEEAEKFPPSPVNADPVQSAEFEDRGFQFDKTYYYAVSTVGSLTNPYAESLLSAACAAAARDVFPPLPPKDFHATTDGGGVLLLWVPSASADAAGYRIYRQEKNTAARQSLQNELITAFSFRDNRVEPGKSYEYTIHAVDAHGNESGAVRAEVEF